MGNDDDDFEEDDEYLPCTESELERLLSEESFSDEFTDASALCAFLLIISDIFGISWNLAGVSPTSSRALLIVDNASEINCGVVF